MHIDMTQQNNKLTIIIPFRNEGDEVEKTVASVRATATTNPRILLINDCSEDEYNYEHVVETYNCRYVRNEQAAGVSGSRDIGVSLCGTPYFVLLDAHMRFYESGWDEKLVSVLESNPGCIITSNTVPFHRDENGNYDANEQSHSGKFNSFGAYVNMSEPGQEYTAKWSKTPLADGEVIPVACVLGAVYASSVAHWKNIHGLWGLHAYGYDEPLMSIKTWLSGGRCLLIKNWGVGHLYRKRRPYSFEPASTPYNMLLMIALFSTEKNRQTHIDNCEERFKSLFPAAVEEYEKNREAIEAHRKHLETHVFKHDFDYFKNINLKAK
jgi:glycosyltransferase involved in cell wall biosynthesis